MKLRTVDRQRPTACLLLVLATLCWGLSFPLMKASAMLQQEMLPNVSSWFLAALTLTVRFGSGAIILVLLCWKTLRHITRREVWQGSGLALFGGAGMLLQNDGVIYTSASTAAFLTQFYCLVIPLWLALRHRRLPSRITIAACVLVLCGVALLADINILNFTIGRGEAEILLCSCFFAGQILWLERAEFNENNVLHATLVMFALIGAVMFCLSLVTVQRSSDMLAAITSPPLLILMALLTLVCTVVPYILMNAWQRFLSATQAGLIYCAEPLFTGLAALFLPAMLSQQWNIQYSNETLTTRLLIGGGLILIANLIIQLRPDNALEPVQNEAAQAI